jgi:hypothetical protein
VFYKEGEFGGYLKERVAVDDVEVIMRDDVKPSLKIILVPEDATDEEQERTFLLRPTKHY